MAPDGGKDTGTAAAFAGEENPTPPERESCWEEPAQQCLASSVLSHHEWWLFFCLGKGLVPFYILPARIGAVSSTESQKLCLSADRFAPGSSWLGCRRRELFRGTTYLKQRSSSVISFYKSSRLLWFLCMPGGEAAAP